MVGRIEYAGEKPLLVHQIRWKHLQEPDDFAHLQEFNHVVRSDHKVMASAAAHDGDDGDRKESDKRREFALGGVSAAHNPESSVNVAGVGVVGRKVGDGAHRRARAPASGKAYVGYQEAATTSSPKPFGNPLLPRHPKPAEAAAPLAFACHARQENDGIDLYRLGLEAAMAMDDETILSEVARHVGVEVHHQQQQRPQRRPTRQKKAPAAMKARAFTLRLSDEEAMEDVAAVSLVKDVKAEAAPVSRKGKRRRD